MESPIMGYIIPYSWQEPGADAEFEPEDSDDRSDFDDEGQFTL